MASPPPQIFSPKRRAAIRRRMLALQAGADPVRYLHEDVAEDVIERLGFLRHQPARTLIIGDAGSILAQAIAPTGTQITADPDFPLEQPWPLAGFDRRPDRNAGALSNSP